MTEGVAWARPPRWVDPFRRLIRNTLHTGADQAYALGRQMRLALNAQGPQGAPEPGGPLLADTG